jgi:hypothetical protein
METILSTHITISVSQMMMALTVSMFALLLGHLKLALLICYCYVLYWSQIWDFSLFTGIGTWKFSSPEFIVPFFFIILLLLMLLLIFHNE